jgi:hypothetical protein
VFLRGKATERLISLYYASGFETHARRCVSRVFVVERGKPQSKAKPDCSKRNACAESGVGRSRRSILHAVKRQRAREHGRKELHLFPCRSSGAGASPSHCQRPKPKSRRRSYSFGCSRPKPITPARVPSEFEYRVSSPKRVGSCTFVPKVASHQRVTEVDRRRKTRSGEFDDNSHGVRFLSASKPGRSLC